jgi:hypothetical protein
MDIHVNLLAVLVAAVVNYAIAMIWYGAIFGKLWQKLTGITDMKPAPLNIILVFLGSFLLSFVLYHAIFYAGEYHKIAGVSRGLMVGFFNWLGFVAPVTLTTKLYEKKPWGLWLLDNGFWLISLLTMGIILSVWM